MRASTVIGFVAAQRRDPLFVERAQHLGLCFQAHVAHFIEKQRSAVRLLKLPSLSTVAPGNDPL